MQALIFGLFAMLFCSCKTFNPLLSLEKRLTVEEYATKAIEQKRYADALRSLRSKMPENARIKLVLNEVSPSEHEEIVQVNYADLPDRNVLYSLYAIAYIGDSGVDYLEILKKMASVQESEIAALLTTLLAMTKGSKDSQKALETAVKLRSLIPDDKKKAPDIITDIVLTFIVVVLNLDSLDQNNTKTIGPKDIDRLDDTSAISIYHALSEAVDMSAKLCKLDSNKNYLLLHSKVAGFYEGLDATAGDPATKVRIYLKKVLEKHGAISYTGIIEESYVALATDPRLPPKPAQPHPQMQKLTEKRARYLSLIKVDSLGWLKDTVCDGLLFNGLFNVGGGQADLLAARDASGGWNRNPEKNCLETNGSSSAVSRDMIMGLLTWIWASKRLDVVSDLISFLEQNKNPDGFWVLGKGDISDTLVNPDLENTIRLLREKLAGDPLSPQSRTWIPTKEYHAHIQILDLLLRANIQGGVTEREIALLKYYSEHEPNNALFAALYHRYSDQDMSSAINILLNEDLFPDNRLPDTSMHCEFYLWQRNERDLQGQKSDSWGPCPKEDRVLSGVDFLFAAALVLEN